MREALFPSGTGLLIITPPLRIFEIQLFSHLLLFSKNLGLFSQLLLVSKNFPPAAGFYYFQFFWAQNLTSEKLIFRQKSRFCLVKHPKNFRLRRANNARFLLTSKKNSPAAQFLLFSNFCLKNFPALIILKFSSQNSHISYYLNNEGGFIINTSVYRVTNPRLRNVAWHYMTVQ